MSNKPIEFYGKREAGLMAGIAILLMMVHHFFGFKGWLMEGNGWTPIVSYHNILERTMSGFGFICIAIFAFSSGYVLYRRPQEYRYGSGLLKRGLKFLTGYWLCLMVFYILAVIFSSPLPNLSELASNMIGLDCAPKKPWVNAPFAWYVTYYLCYLLITPPIIRLLSTKYIAIDIALFSIVTLGWFGLTDQGNFMYPLCYSIAGVLAAKYNVLNRLGVWMSQRSVWLPLALLVVSIVVRDKSWFLPRGLWLVLECLLTIVWIVCCVTVINRVKSRYNTMGRHIEAALLLLGALSMPLWFLHGLFFTQLPLQWLLYLPHLSVLVLLWGLVLLIPVAMGVKWLQGFVWRKIN